MVTFWTHTWPQTTERVLFTVSAIRHLPQLATNISNNLAHPSRQDTLYTLRQEGVYHAPSQLFLYGYLQ